MIFHVIKAANLIKSVSEDAYYYKQWLSLLQLNLYPPSNFLRFVNKIGPMGDNSQYARVHACIVFLEEDFMSKCGHLFFKTLSNRLINLV